MIKYLLVFVVLLFMNFGTGFSENDKFWKERTSIFKGWRLDTLSKLKSISLDSFSLSKKAFILFPKNEFKLREGELNYGCEKLEVIYDDVDSEYIKFIYYYSEEINIDRIDLQKGLIKSLLDEIREKDSLPSSNFNISFEVHLFFYPSPMEGWNYDYVHEIKNLKIIVPSEFIIEYDELRGNIHGKQTYKIFKN